MTVQIDNAVSAPEEIDVDAVRAASTEVAEAPTKKVDDVEHLQLLDHREWCQTQIPFIERRPDWVPENI